MKKLLSLSFFGLASAGAFAQAFTINELFVNPAGTDDGFEYAEIKGTPGASLAGHSFISIEGDGSSAGLADRVVDLSAFSIGANGLLLIRFGTSSITALEAATTVVDVALPGMENGSNSWAIANFVPTQGTDLDTNNDGAFDLGSGQSVIDSLGWIENATSTAYGLVYDRATFGTFTPDAFYRMTDSDARVFGDVFGPSGLQDIDTTADEFAIYSQYRGAHQDGTSRDSDWENWANSGFANPGDSNRLNVIKLTPGGVNPVPEPASMAVLGLGILGLARRRRNK